MYIDLKRIENTLRIFNFYGYDCGIKEIRRKAKKYPISLTAKNRRSNLRLWVYSDGNSYTVNASWSDTFERTCVWQYDSFSTLETGLWKLLSEPEGAEWIPDEQFAPVEYMVRDHYGNIYDFLYTANCTIVDHSHWQDPVPSYYRINQPLLLIARCEAANLRFWIRHNQWDYQLTYVPLDLDIYSHAYHDSITSKTFKTQHKLLAALHELLHKEDGYEVPEGV